YRLAVTEGTTMGWHLGFGRLPTVLLILSAFATGCIKVGPDYAQPPVDTAANWLDAQDPRLKTNAMEQRNWWKVFNDPVLDRLIDAAYRQNLPLRVAGI